MKGFKKLTSCLCAAALAVSLSVPALGYSDVAEADWFYKDIQAATDQGLMGGDAHNMFTPGGLVTRATVLTVLWRLEGSPVTKTAVPFTDIPEKNWAYAPAAWAKEVGIAAGYSGGDFGPGDVVTREQLAVFLYRYAQFKGDDIAEGVVDLYPDAQYINDWALPGMKHALGAGLMKGTSKGLSPLGFATRAELATILVRLTTPVQG